MKHIPNILMIKCLEAIKIYSQCCGLLCTLSSILFYKVLALKRPMHFMYLYRITTVMLIYVYFHAPVGSVSKYLSVHYQNDKMLSRLAMGTPQKHPEPVLLHEDENVPRPYDGTVREVSALYSDIAANKVQL